MFTDNVSQKLRYIIFFMQLISSTLINRYRNRFLKIKLTYIHLQNDTATFTFNNCIK